MWSRAFGGRVSRRPRASIPSISGDAPIGHDLLAKLRTPAAKVTTSPPATTPREIADTDPDGEQHIDHCTTHPVEPAAAAIASKVLLIRFPSICPSFPLYPYLFGKARRCEAFRLVRQVAF
jgi:hypothetical protein